MICANCKAEVQRITCRNGKESCRECEEEVVKGNAPTVIMKGKGWGAGMSKNERQRRNKFVNGPRG